MKLIEQGNNTKGTSKRLVSLLDSNQQKTHAVEKNFILIEVNKYLIYKKNHKAVGKMCETSIIYNDIK